MARTASRRSLCVGRGPGARLVSAEEFRFEQAQAQRLGQAQALGETSAPDSPYVLASELDVRWCALGWYFQLLGGPEKRADCKRAIYDSFIRPALEVDREAAVQPRARLVDWSPRAGPAASHDAALALGQN